MKDESDVEIFDATEEEVELVYSMGYEIFQNKNKYDWGWDKDFLQILRKPDFGFIHVAKISKRIIGFHCGVWNYPESAHTQCRMYWIYIIPSFRGMKISKSLINYSLGIAKQLGKTSVCIGVWETDEIASSLVKEMGFSARTSLIIYQREI